MFLVLNLPGNCVGNLPSSTAAYFERNAVSTREIHFPYLETLQILGRQISQIRLINSLVPSGQDIL